MKTLTLILTLLSLSAIPNPPTKLKAKAEKPDISSELFDISGYYVCKGKEVSGKTYSGVAVITRKGDVYLIQWTIGAGAAFAGVAIRQGNTLAASWAIPTDSKGVIRGINLYKIESGPKLVGRWATMPGPGIVQGETLTFLKALEEDDE